MNDAYDNARTDREMLQRTLDIEWVLDDEVNLMVTKGTDGEYRVSDADNAAQPALVLCFVGERLTFNGQDTETDNFIDYVGIMEAADDIIERMCYALPATVFLGNETAAPVDHLAPRAMTEEERPEDHWRDARGAVPDGGLRAEDAIRRNR